jgi:hypothetical protein
MEWAAEGGVNYSGRHDLEHEITAQDTASGQIKASSSPSFSQFKWQKEQ